MSCEVVTQIIINAPVARLWQALCDFRAYPDWNPFLRRIEGEPRNGSRLAVTVHLPGHPSWRLRSRVTRVHSGRELAWLNYLLVPGLLAAEHAFLLVPLDEHRTQLVQRQRFSGLLSTLVWPMVRKNMRRGLMLTNAALKNFIEKPQKG
jgi:hypothetical protein